MNRHQTRDGNTVFNAISAGTETVAESMLNQRRELETLYWGQHQALASVEFKCRDEQRHAMDRLGRLAIALTALDTAYSALNKCRCL